MSTMLSSKIYMFWMRKCSEFLINNQNIAVDLQNKTETVFYFQHMFVQAY